MDVHIDKKQCNAKYHIYNNDCLDVLKNIPDNSVDLVVTDCPYKIVSGGCTNVPRKDEPSGIFNRRSAFTQQNAKSGKLFDFNDISFKDWLPDVYRILKADTHCYIMINSRNLKELQQECENVGFKFQQLLVWDKGNVTPNRYYLNSCEFILMLRKGKAKNINNMGTKNVLKISNIIGNKNHPTEKPIDLMEIFVVNSSQENELVLDPFMGVGSTGLACIKNNRNFLGIEIDENYFNIAKSRLGGSMKYKLLQGDCLKLMQDIPDKSIDMILCDLPYGTSACKWDNIISFEPLWEQYNRIIKDNCAIVLFANQPFTSKLIISNLKLYKYNWVWVKDNATNFLNKKFQPGKITEDICVFGKMATSYSKNGNMKYFPQMESGKPYKTTNNVKRRTNAVIRSEIVNVTTDNKGTRYPNNVLYFNRDKDKLHSTQKPVALLEYLIKTYTNEGDLVLDNCMGSGSCGVACVNTNRNFLGMELNEDYFNIAKERINNKLKEEI